MLRLSRRSAEADSTASSWGSIQPRRGIAGPGSCVVLILAAYLAGTFLGCAGRFRFLDDVDSARYRHLELGYEIAYPKVLSNPRWKIVDLDESDLLVRHPDGSAWAIASNCRATAARVETLAAELARATGGKALGPGQSIQQSGLEGYAQRLVGSESGQPIEIKTVTLRGPRCTYDWILLAPNAQRFEVLEPDFDLWWQSFVPGPGDRSSEADP